MAAQNIDDVWQEVLQRQQDGKQLKSLEHDVALALDTDFELTSGGIVGYLASNTANRLAQAVSVFRAVGASRTADLLDELRRFFPGGKPGTSPLARQRQIDKMVKAKREELLAERDYDEEGMTLRALLWTHWNAHSRSG